MVQWIRLHVPNAGGTGLILGQGTKIPYASQCGLEKKKIHFGAFPGGPVVRTALSLQ